MSARARSAPAGRRPVIAIDGPAAAGKSTAGKALAARLGLVYVDTGALYRAAGWLAEREGIVDAPGQVIGERVRRADIRLWGPPEGLRVLVDGRDVAGQIRTERVGRLASRLSALPEVRAALLDVQRRLGAGGGVVMDGRDIGTVILPEAEFKFFLSASPEGRARRRWVELGCPGGSAGLERTLSELVERDRRDSGREHAPLRPAEDAVAIDTTELSPEEVVTRMLEVVESRSG